MGTINLGQCECCGCAITLDFTFEIDETDCRLVHFTRIVETDCICTYEWDFGDGETSTEENPSHLYECTDDVFDEDRLFEPCLTAYCNDGSQHTVCKVVFLCPCHDSCETCMEAIEGVRITLSGFSDVDNCRPPYEECFNENFNQTFVLDNRVTLTASSTSFELILGDPEDPDPANWGILAKRRTRTLLGLPECEFAVGSDCIWEAYVWKLSITVDCAGTVSISKLAFHVVDYTNPASCDSATSPVELISGEAMTQDWDLVCNHHGGTFETTYVLIGSPNTVNCGGASQVINVVGELIWAE